jgi:C4-type Zn-finger protein
MDDQELQRARAWLAKWPQKPCPVCGTRAWHINPHLGQIKRLPVGPEPTGRVPVLVVACQTCGYFLTVNAILAGVRQPPFD